MRKTVLVPVEKTLCDAHIARDGSEEEATDTLALGAHTWDLCTEHTAVFGQYLVDALGAGVQDGDGADADPDAEPVATESEPATVAEPVSADVESEGDAAGRASEDATEPEPMKSVMISGEIDGYDWADARQAVRNLGYEVVGRADDSTVLLLLGEHGERNGTKLRDARERAIPCMDVRVPGRFKSAICAGELVGGDPLPEPAKVGPKAMTERDRNRAVRAWARENGYVVPSKGRIPMHVKHAYELTHKDAAGKAVAA
ncbi:histone-like nucleoid-structuring protein Lsr2 [Streptomyces sp. NPDC057743]|uniref:Lsr2 family DNA-binding protein n=1 Tax=Streptomyces sp. NPDC057743 TaxID=3346236 RepID=UPI0036C726DA